MSSGIDVHERFFGLWGTICKLIMDHKRDPKKVISILEDFLGEKIVSTSDNPYVKLNDFWAGVWPRILNGECDQKKFAAVLQKIINESSSKPKGKPENFRLIQTIKGILIPNDYDHNFQIARHYAIYGNVYRSWHAKITDEHFSNPTNKLIPGMQLAADIYKQISNLTNSEEQLAFLKGQPGTLLVGVQGLTIIMEQKREELPPGYRYVSLDERNRLWIDFDREDQPPQEGIPKVPFAGRDYDGRNFKLSLLSFGHLWEKKNCYLRFYEI